MSIVNSVRLIGHLGKDAEIKGDSTQFTTFSIATTEKWKDKEGNQKEETQWHNCTMSGSALAKYLLKGAKVAVEGKLTYREYTDKDGNKKQATQIRVNEIQIVQFVNDAAKSSQPQSGQPQNNFGAIPDDEQLPF